MAPDTISMRFEDKQHLARGIKKKRRRSWAKVKSRSGICAYSAEFVRVWAEMYQEYKLCLDGRFYFGGEKNHSMPFITRLTRHLLVFHLGNGSCFFFFYVTSVMRLGGLQCKLAARLGLKNASLRRELLPSAAWLLSAPSFQVSSASLSPSSFLLPIKHLEF